MASLGSRGISSSASRSSISGSRAASSSASAANAGVLGGQLAGRDRGRRGPGRARWPSCGSGSARRTGGPPGGRRPGRRGSPGRRAARSSSAYSASSAPSRSVISCCRSLVPSARRVEHANARRPRAAGGGRGTKATCRPSCLSLGVLLLELRHPTGGVEHPLLARVERVADVAGLHVDLPFFAVLRVVNVLPQEQVTSVAHVLRVNVVLHAWCVLLVWSPGRRRHRHRNLSADGSGVNRNREPDGSSATATHGPRLRGAVRR